MLRQFSGQTTYLVVAERGDYVLAAKGLIVGYGHFWRSQRRQLSSDRKRTLLDPTHGGIVFGNDFFKHFIHCVGFFHQLPSLYDASVAAVAADDEGFRTFSQQEFHVRNDSVHGFIER